MSFMYHGPFCAILGESGLFHVRFGKKVHFFMCILGDSRLLCVLFGIKASLEAPGALFLGKILKNVIVYYAFRYFIIKLYSIPISKL